MLAYSTYNDMYLCCEAVRSNINLTAVRTRIVRRGIARI